MIRIGRLNKSKFDKISQYHPFLNGSAGPMDIYSDIFKEVEKSIKIFPYKYRWIFYLINKLNKHFSFIDYYLINC